MTNVSVIVAPAFMAPFLGQFAERYLTEQRVYGVTYTSGAPMRHEFIGFDGRALLSIECFRTLTDAKTWITRDMAVHLVAQGAVS